MKKSITLITLFALAMAFTGCNKNSSGIKALDYIELGEYKGLKVERMDTTVTDDDIQSEIDGVINSLGTKQEITDRDTVKKGDIANIDYTGTKDGVAFEGGSSVGFDLGIGSGQFIDGFEDGLIGAKVGETVVLKLTFPEVYPNNPDLAGAPVEFAVKVNSISEVVYPEMTDSFIKEQTGGEYTTVKAYREGIRKDLEKEKNEYADTRMYADLLEQAVSNAKEIKDFPEDYVAAKRAIIEENAKSYAESYGVDFNSFLETYMGLTQEDFNTQCDEYALKAAKEVLVITAIAEKEGISVSKSELNDAIKEYTEMYGYESEKAFKEDTNMDQFGEYVLESKVQEFLADNAVITISDEKAW